MISKILASLFIGGLKTTSVKVAKWGGGIIGTYLTYKGLDITYENYILNKELQNINISDEEIVYYKKKLGINLNEEQVRVLKYNDLKAYKKVYQMSEDIEVIKWYENIIKQKNSIKKD